MRAHVGVITVALVCTLLHLGSAQLDTSLCSNPACDCECKDVAEDVYYQYMCISCSCAKMKNKSMVLFSPPNLAYDVNHLYIRDCNELVVAPLVESPKSTNWAVALELSIINVKKMTFDKDGFLWAQKINLQNVSIPKLPARAVRVSPELPLKSLHLKQVNIDVMAENALAPLPITDELLWENVNIKKITTGAINASIESPFGSFKVHNTHIDEISTQGLTVIATNVLVIHSSFGTLYKHSIDVNTEYFAFASCSVTDRIESGAFKIEAISVGLINNSVSHLKTKAFIDVRYGGLFPPSSTENDGQFAFFSNNVHKADAGSLQLSWEPDSTRARLLATRNFVGDCSCPKDALLECGTHAHFNLYRSLLENTANNTCGASRKQISSVCKIPTKMECAINNNNGGIYSSVSHVKLSLYCCVISYILFAFV